MASTYSTNLKIELIGTGEQAGTWGATTNTNLGTALEQAVVGKADVAMSSTTVTLTLTNTNAAQNARAIYLNLTGSPGGAAVLEVPAVEKPYIVKNGSNQQVTIKVSGQTGVPIPTGKTALVYNNGTDVVTAIDFIPSLVLGAALPVASGGTGQTSYSNGQLLVGNNSNGLTKTTLTAGSNITITNGDGSVTIAATSGGGDVVGPSSSTDNGIALFDGTTGKLLQNSASQDGFVNGIRVGKGPGSAVSNNTVFGLSAFGSNTTGERNTGFGSNAAATSTTGNSTTAIGYATLFGQTSGSQNTAVGDSAASSLTTGSDNVAVGYSALPGITTGSENTALGYLALTSTGGAAVTNCSALGYTSTVTGSNQVQLGNASTTTFAFGAVQDRSDERDKTDIRDTQLGLNFITALRPVDYKWDMREDYRTDRNQTLLELTHDGTHKRSRYHHGLIAQEVKAVVEAQGIDFGGYQDHKIKGGDDVLSLGYGELIAPMIKAIQELTARLEAAEAEIAALKG